MPAAATLSRTLSRPCPVRVPVGDARLEGELAIPVGARGLIIFAHGSGSSHRSPRNQAVAQVLHHFGFGTLLFDLLTRCEDVCDFDARLRVDINLLTQRLVGATRWAALQPEARGLALGFFGTSTGGAVALCASVQLGPMIRAIVLRGGRPDFADAALRSVKAPTLLLVGGWDDAVIQLNYEALRKLPCEAELEIIPRATHLFEEPGALEKVGELAEAWFARHLQPAPVAPPT
jgi:putative phosphoribosyl transferase